MAKSQTCLEEKGWRGHRFIFLLSSTSSLIWRQADGIREHGGQRRLGTAQEQLGARGLGVWDPTEQAACERGGWNRSTDRLMAPALHTIGFSLPSFAALGKGLSSSELNGVPRATGPGRPGLIPSGGMKDIGQPSTRGAGGSIQRDKAGRAHVGPQVPSPESPPIFKTQ